MLGWPLKFKSLELKNNGYSLSRRGQFELYFSLKREKSEFLTAKTLADLVFLTRQYLDEAQPADWSVQDVFVQVNFQYQYLVSKVVEVYQEYYLTTIPRRYSTVANQQQYLLTDKFLKIERVEINPNPSEPNSQNQRATAIRMEELPLAINNNLLNGSNLFNIGYYFIGNESDQQIGFVPAPQYTATDNVYIWGIIAPDDLEEDDDIVNIPYADNFAQIIGKMAAGNLLKKGQQGVKYGNDLLSQAASDILNYQNFIVERQSDGVNQVTEAAWDDINVNPSYPY